MRVSRGPRALSAPLAVALLAALSAPSALSGPSALSTGDPPPLPEKTGNYCTVLKHALGRGLGVRPQRDLAAPLRLLGGGAARAAHALLRAALMQGLGVPDKDVELLPDVPDMPDVPDVPDVPGGLCPLLQYVELLMCPEWRKTSYQEINESIPLSVAAAWRGEPCQQSGNDDLFYMGLGGTCYAVHGGAAPAARRLLARRAAGADAACGDSWPDLARPACLFLTPRQDLPPEPRGWPNCTCSSNDTACIPVLVAADGGEEAAAAAAWLAGRICARAAALRPAPPLRLVALSDAELRRQLRAANRSFLFLDYDWWAEAAPGERVRPAPPLPCPGLAACAPLDPAVPVLVAPTRLMRQNMPHVVCVLARFRPAPATLRRLLTNERALGTDEAACEAALSAGDDLLGWANCTEYAVLLYVLPCGDLPAGFVETITDIIFAARNWTVTLQFTNTTVGCEDVQQPNEVFNDMLKTWMGTQVVGAVVLGAAGAGLLPHKARARGIPLLLGEAGEAGEAAGGCGVSPGAARLQAALRFLLARCGWRRVAVLRDESRAADWQNFSRSGELVVHEQPLGAGGAAPALAALRALDARVVVLDAGAAAAECVLAAAARAGMGPARGYAWLVLRAAGERADWVPTNESRGFSYVTLSGWWRGGGGAPGGDPGLRAAAEARLPPRWPPLTAPLLDALLVMMTGMEYFLAQDSNFQYNHSEESRLLVLERLRNTSVAGVAQNQSCGGAPLVFVHRWSEDETAGRLLAVWPAAEGPAPAALCEAGVRDAAPCRSTRSGPAFAPVCHDAAWAVALAALLLAPPALCAAAAARRARLRRRDRAVEQRALARRGRAALAAAALQAHSVPRAALELLDELGAGHYGSVRLALLRAPPRAPLAVAAKAPRADAAAEAEAELLREAALLATLRHEHVVRFAGVCFEGAPLVLMEHAFHGDLRRYLRARRPALERARAGEPEPEAAHVGAAALTRLAREAAAALGYLALHRLVHRDVRAANCLVDARRSLKLADFGLARRLGGDGEGGEAGEAGGAGEYLCRRRALFPVLWMAPESLARGVFSPASDVWALGVLMLELATLGARPFGAWPAPQVVRHVRAGGAPPLPSDAAASTRGVAATCWRRAAAERPTAPELVAWLAAHPRALRPALLPLEGEAGAPHEPQPDLYRDEWAA